MYKSQLNTVEDFCPDDALDRSFLDDVGGSAVADDKHDSDRYIYKDIVY